MATLALAAAVGFVLGAIGKHRAVFAGLINQAKSAGKPPVLKYVARASVAVPLSSPPASPSLPSPLMLVERFGHVTAYWLVAGGLAAMGFIASIVVSARSTGKKPPNSRPRRAIARRSSATAPRVLVQPPSPCSARLMTMPAARQAHWARRGWWDATGPLSCCSP